MHSGAEPSTRALVLLVPRTAPKVQAQTVRGFQAPCRGSEGYAAKH